MIRRPGIVEEVQYFGPSSGASVDYPDFAKQVCEAVVSGKADAGILVCGTGIGMSIAANKVRGIRAALCHDHVTAQLCRLHNDANVLCIGERTSGLEVMRDIIETYLATDFSRQARHVGRLEKVKAMEEANPHL